METDKSIEDNTKQTNDLAYKIAKMKMPHRRSGEDQIIIQEYEGF